MNEIYSSHVFIFPFQYSKGKRGKVNKESFAKGFPEFIREGVRDLDEVVEYNISKYFNDAAKRAIFTTSFKHPDAEIVLNYECDFDKLATYCENQEKDIKFEFVIEKNNDVYTLSMKRVRIKLYDNNIGMILFYLDNCNYHDDETVNIINEYGRRISMPFCEKKEKKCFQVADRILIKCNGESIPFSISEINGNVQTDERMFLPNFIKAFLLKDYESERVYNIKPAIYDRMFVACIFQNESVSKKL